MDGLLFRHGQRHAGIHRPGWISDWLNTRNPFLTCLHGKFTMEMTRPARRFAAPMLLFLAVALAPTAYGEYREADIDSLQSMMESGELTAVELTRYYIDRIGCHSSCPPLDQISKGTSGMLPGR